MQKILLLLATVLALPPALALGQTTEELNSDGKNPENVLTQSMGSGLIPAGSLSSSRSTRTILRWRMSSPTGRVHQTRSASASC